MSTPTDSVAPPYPTGTSSPWPMPAWWKRIADWLAALSPSGADKYDTGWVDITPASGVTANRAQVRRIGKEVIYRGSLTGSLSTTVVDLGTAPTGFRPADAADATRATAHGNATTGWGQITSAGVIRARLASGTATTATFLSCFSGYTVD